MSSLYLQSKHSVAVNIDDAIHQVRERKREENDPGNLSRRET